jgi:hypothetical protein
MGFPGLLSAADVAVLQHLGETVLYTPGTNPGPTATAVTGIFDQSCVVVDAGQAGASSCGPAVFLRLADLPSDPAVDEPSISVRGIAYRVREAKPDGQGGVLLLLHRV